jgi:hypothetical protein
MLQSYRWEEMPDWLAFVGGLLALVGIVRINIRIASFLERRFPGWFVHGDSLARWAMIRQLGRPVVWDIGAVVLGASMFLSVLAAHL